MSHSIAQRAQAVRQPSHMRDTRHTRITCHARGLTNRDRAPSSRACALNIVAERVTNMHTAVWWDANSLANSFESAELRLLMPTKRTINNDIEFGINLERRQYGCQPLIE